jgi:hypothetical protein
MQSVHEGQCGLCKHFGEPHQTNNNLIEIRKTAKAPEIFVDECGHPRLATLHLKVTPISGCDGFEKAIAA